MLCSENCLIISEINNNTFETNKTELLRFLYRDNKLLLSFILRLPDLFPERKGRKKATSLFVFNTSANNQEFHNVEIYTMKFNSANSARVLHEHPYVNLLFHKIRHRHLFFESNRPALLCTDAYQAVHFLVFIKRYAFRCASSRQY